MGEKRVFNLDIFKMGYFILYRNEGGFFGNAIEKTQKQKFDAEYAKYTHIEVSGGGPWSVAVIPPKTKIVDITKKHKGRYVKVVAFKAEDYKIKRYKVAFWASSNCNLAYDWFGVARFKFNLLFHFLKKFFCSENTAWALYKEYPNALGIKPEDCMPAHFCNPNYFETIWEGKIE